MRPLNLRLLSPPLRLLFVALATSGILFFENFYVILPVVVISVVIFVSSGRISWRSVYLIVIPTTILYFAGNALFSPPSKGGIHYLIFCLNSYGLKLAIIRSLRIGSVLLISLAWLASTPIIDLYSSVAPLPKIRPWALSICRTLQLTKREFLSIGQSLKIRGMQFASLATIIKTCDWFQVRRNVSVFLALLRVVISRQFTHISKATLAWERHHPLAINASKSDTAVVVQGLFVRYQTDIEPAIRNANLTVKPGSVVYVTGLAQSGKSSLLRALGGIIPRVSGEIAGRIYISSVDTTNIALGQYSSFATYTDADVESNILGLTVGQEMMLMARNETRARHCLKVMGMEKLWERETTKLSGGQQVRLLLAGTLACDADVIILDDPLDQLDPSGCRDFIAALAKILKEKEKTVLIADRHYNYFLPLINVVLPIEHGTLQELTLKNELSDQESLKRWGIGSIDPKILTRNKHPGKQVARMENVYVSIDNSPILKGVNLEIAEGEVVIIQGPNGSGKTTAMLALAGVIKPIAGGVKVAGRVGYLFQDASSQILAPTVFEELALAPRMLGYSDQDTERIVSGLLTFTGLCGSKSPLDLHPQELKMLAMAAMSVGVRVMILDEPTVGLDSIGIMKVMQFVENLRSDGMAIFIISHDEAFGQLGDRVLWFEDGRCIARRQSQQIEEV